MVHFLFSNENWKYLSTFNNNVDIILYNPSVITHRLSSKKKEMHLLKA